MEVPGMSLFQGAASIHINNSAQDRLEEQEEIEDQKRRNEELKHKLANAFDDLLDDDEPSSVNSSGNYTMDAGHPNGGTRAGREERPGLPTYVESLNHLKEVQHKESGLPFCETPKNFHHDDPGNHNFSPYGAGDGQNQYYHQEYRGHLNGVNNFEARQEYMNYEQLKLMYEMRVKECQQLAAQLEELRSQSDMETDSLRARLATTASDRDKAELSLQQAHHLLASSKHKMVELEQQVTSLTEKLSENEQDKEQLRLELKSANLSLQEVQQRFHTLQVAHSHDTDALFREQQDRHREEIDRLHNDLQKAKNRLEEKENEIRTLEKRCLEKDREKEEILVDKGSTINRLASELEQAQSRLVSGESAKLKEKVQQLTSERNTSREQVKELGSKLELTAHELVLCRNKLAASQKEFENWRTSLHQILSESLPDNNYLGEPPSPGKLSTLKDILSRYKLQLQKFSSLQEELNKRDKRLDVCRKTESELRSKLEEQRGVEMQLSSRVAVLQNKLELLQSSSDGELLHTYQRQNEQLNKELLDARAEYKNLDLKYTELEMEYDKLKSEKGGRATLVQEANSDLLKELERYSAQLKETLKENGELKNLYLQACSSRDQVTREIKDITQKLQKEKELQKTQEKEYMEKLQAETAHVTKLTGELSNYKGELERANKRISELQKEFTDKQKEFTSKLNKYLEDERKSIRKEIDSCTQCEKYLKTIKSMEEQLHKCTIRLATQESNEELMKELKSKAEFFQKYILERFQKLQELRTVGTCTEPFEVGTKSEEHKLPNGHKHSDDECHDDDIQSKTNLMLKEKEIREQIAEKFTLEIKTIEMNSAKKLKEMENEHISAITKLKQLLEKKAQEVETLKNFILSERSKVTELLNAKEQEISELIREHNSLQAEYQQLKDKAEGLKDRYVDKYKLLDEKFRNERETLKRNMADWEKEKQELISKMARLDSEHEMLKTKYKNAKRTAFMYKDYVEKKDEHVNGELKRIQNEYMDIFMKMENKIKFLINCRLQQNRNEQAQSSNQHEGQQSEYAEMINRLQNDISALAQSRYGESPDWR